MTTGFLDPLLTVTIALAQSAAALADFGVFYLPEPGTATFAEDVRRFASPDDVATALAATEISARTAAALNAAFALDRPIGQIAVGKMAAGTAQDTDITIAGTIADPETFTLTVDQWTVSYTTTGGDLANDVALGLEAALNAVIDDNLFSVGTPSGGVFFIIGPGSVPFSVVVSTDSAAGTITAVDTASADDPTLALDTLRGIDDDWYALVPELKGTGFQDALDDWAETNKKYMWAQTSDALNLTADAAAIGPIVDSANRAYSSALHHDDDAEDMALLAAARWLSFNPDNGPTSPTKSQLTGITKNEDLTTSNVATLDGINVAYYHTFRGVNAMSEVRTGSGISARTRLLLDWMESRIGTALANMFLNAAAIGQPIPYDDFGFARALGVVQAFLDRAAEIGWLRVVLDPNTNQRISPLASVPRRSAVSAGDAAAKRIPITFVAHDAGEALGAAITGTVTDATTV